LGVSEWTIFALLFAGFWDKRLGILGALGATITFFTTVTIIPFMPNGWDPAAGFPAMAGEVPFLMKDIVFLAVSIYLLKQDLVRMSFSNSQAEMVSTGPISTAFTKVEFSIANDERDRRRTACRRSYRPNCCVRLIIRACNCSLFGKSSESRQTLHSIRRSLSGRSDSCGRGIATSYSRRPVFTKRSARRVEAAAQPVRPSTEQIALLAGAECVAVCLVHRLRTC